MVSITHVVRRGRALHFRRAVPADLRDRLRRRELTHSLGIIAAGTVRLRAAELYIATERLFRSVRGSPMLTEVQLARLVQDFYATVLERENATRLVGPALDDAVLETRGAYYADVAAKTRKALAANRLDEARFITEAMLRKQGVATAELSSADWRRARQAVLRAGIDVAEAIQARYAGDFNHEPRDGRLRERLADLAVASPPTDDGGMGRDRPGESTDANSDPGPPAPAIPASLSRIAERFLADQVESRAWEKQSAAQARATLRLFTEICGDRAVAAYTREDAGHFKEALQRLPFDYGKAARYRGLPVATIIERYGREPVALRAAPITAKTIKRHFSALSTLWQWAAAREPGIQPIFLGFRFGGAKRAVDQRAMWERDELARLFKTPIWSGCHSAERRATPGHLVLRDEKFWLPLIAVFSGMRQEEICQLDVGDVREAEGIWYFDVHTREDQRLKNATAVRRVPLHAELVRLGFLDYVDGLRRARETRLFPGLKPGGSDDRYGHAYAKWFTRYRRAVGLDRPGLVFHSFRHSATTFMAEADVQTAIIDRVTGHITAGETARYTKRYTMAQLKAAIDAIDIGVDFGNYCG